MKIRDKVYVVDWGKRYSVHKVWNNIKGESEKIFPFKTDIPDFSTIEYHWEYKYEPNLTLKGTVNKREPKKLVAKIPIYKDYKWEVLEIIKHPKAGEFIQSEEVRKDWEDKGGMDNKYTEENILLLASTHTKVSWKRCYVIIEESGVSKLTPEQYKSKKAENKRKKAEKFIELNLGKWDRNTLVKDDIPNEIISRFYDKNDNVLFGSSMVKGLVSYEYIDGKFSTDGKHIFIRSSVFYDGYGNSRCPNPELIRDFKWIKRHIGG